MGGFLVRSVSEFLKEFLNKEIPDEEFIFRRVPLNLFLNEKPIHRLGIVRGMFRNKKGDGMSADWERITPDPIITQTRDGRDPSKFGVVVLSVFDIKNTNNYTFKVINDQFPYPAHCLVEGIPMSLDTLKKDYRNEFDQLSDEERSAMDSLLVGIREYLCDQAFWVTPLRNPKLRDPPPEFDYYSSFSDKIKKFFTIRGHPIPS